MSEVQRRSWDWVLAEPDQILVSDFFNALPRSTLAGTFLSSVLSYALAKTLMLSPLVGGSRGSSLPVAFMLHFSMQILSFAFAAVLMSRVARLVTGQRSSIAFWI